MEKTREANTIAKEYDLKEETSKDTIHAGVLLLGVLICSHAAA